MKKRLLAVLLAITLAAGICDAPVFAMTQAENVTEVLEKTEATDIQELVKSEQSVDMQKAERSSNLQKETEPEQTASEQKSKETESEQTAETPQIEEIAQAEQGADSNGITEITLGKEQLSGKVTGATESKTYKFTIAQSGRVTWNVLSYVNYTMEILDSDGKVVWTEGGLCSSSVNYRRDIQVTDLIQGTYYLKFIGVKSISTDSGSTGTADAAEGTWQIDTAFTGVNETYPEPNNNNSQAVTLPFQKNVTGQIAENDDRDIYKVTLKSAGRITINLTSYMKYYSIDLCDASGNRVWKSDYNEWNENMGSRSDTHQIDLLEGIYYMEITGKKAVESALSIGENIKATGTYQFSVTYNNAKVNHKEPNNDFTTACGISSGAAIKGQIAQNDSCDVFQFSLTRKQDIKISMTSYMRFYCLYIYDSNGNQRWYKENNEWDANTGNRKDSYTVTLEKGNYYIKVTGNEWSSYNPHTGTYTLKVTYKAAIKNATVSKISSQTYNGKAKKPQITVKYNNTKLVKNKDYEISYSNNKNIGTAKVTIKGKGDYTGTKQITFKIVPKKTALTGAKNSKKNAAVITWKKVSKVTGYEIYRSTSKSKGYKKIKTVKKNKITSFTDTKLKKGKTYYYKVRAYKTVKKQKYYSGYSKIKAVKIIK